MSETKDHYERCVRIANALFKGGANPLTVRAFLILELDEKLANDRIEHMVNLLEEIVACEIDAKHALAIIDATMHSFTAAEEAVTFLQRVEAINGGGDINRCLKFAFGATVFSHFIRIPDDDRTQCRERLIDCYSKLLRHGEKICLNTLSVRLKIEKPETWLSQIALDAAPNPKGTRAVEALSKVDTKECDLVMATNALAVAIREFGYRMLKATPPKDVIRMLASSQLPKTT